MVSFPAPRINRREEEEDHQDDNRKSADFLFRDEHVASHQPDLVPGLPATHFLDTIPCRNQFLVDSPVPQSRQMASHMDSTAGRHPVLASGSCSGASVAPIERRQSPATTGSSGPGLVDSIPRQTPVLSAAELDARRWAIVHQLWDLEQQATRQRQQEMDAVTRRTYWRMDVSDPFTRHVVSGTGNWCPTRSPFGLTVGLPSPFWPATPFMATTAPIPGARPAVLPMDGSGAVFEPQQLMQTRFQLLSHPTTEWHSTPAPTTGHPDTSRSPGADSLSGSDFSVANNSLQSPSNSIQSLGQWIDVSLPLQIRQSLDPWFAYRVPRQQQDDDDQDESGSWSPDPESLDDQQEELDQDYGPEDEDDDYQDDDYEEDDD